MFSNLPVVAPTPRLRNEKVSSIGIDPIVDLYENFARLALYRIQLIVRDRDLAEELLQDVLLTVVKSVHTFDSSRGEIGPWFLTIARNRAIDHMRSLSGQMRRAALPFEDRLHGPTCDMECYYDTALMTGVLADAMKSLNGSQREVIQLAYFEGLSQAQAAQQLGEPLGTVKTRVRSALAKLRLGFDTKLAPHLPVAA